MTEIVQLFCFVNISKLCKAARRRRRRRIDYLKKNLSNVLTPAVNLYKRIKALRIKIIVMI